MKRLYSLFLISEMAQRSLSLSNQRLSEFQKYNVLFGKWKHCRLVSICVDSSMANSSCWKGNEQLILDLGQYAR